MKTFLIILTLSGCSSIPIDDTKIQKGSQVSAPYGYVELCKRTPSVPECTGVSK
jgi:uncharacterized protein YceK